MPIHLCLPAHATTGVPGRHKSKRQLQVFLKTYACCLSCKDGTDVFESLLCPVRRLSVAHLQCCLEHHLVYAGLHYAGGLYVTHKRQGQVKHEWQCIGLLQVAWSSLAHCELSVDAAGPASR